MKIFFINTVCGSGSTGRIITDLCDILRRRDHQVRVAYGVGNASRINPSEAVRISNKADYYVHNGLSRLTDRAGFYSYSATYRLISEIRAFKPDLIHLHNLHGYYVNIKVLFDFLAEADIPVVWTLHDCWTMTGRCSSFSYVKCDRWKTGCGGCRHPEIYPKSYGTDQSRRNFLQKEKLFTSVKNMTVVTPSKWLADVAGQSYLKKYPIVTIPNGIDLDVFRPTASDIRQRYGIGNRKMVLAVANVWEDKKGYPDLLQLARRLNPETYQIVMVGLTKDQASRVPAPIIPVVRTSSVEELVKFYSAADVFVNPSYEETMGMVTLEALACGTPVVVYDRTAVPEVVDSASGVVVKAGSIEEIEPGIEKAILLSPEKAVERARHYEKKQQYQKYIREYGKLLGNE